MQKYAGILLIVVLVTLVSQNPCHSKSVGQSDSEENDSPLILLGYYNAQPKSNARSRSSIGIQAQQTSYYFLSQNAAPWSLAKSDCKAYLGDDATLLNIETREELAAVTSYLQSSDDTGSSYWTGGKYDVSERRYVWETSNGDVSVESWAPWLNGQPGIGLPITRISLYRAGSLGLRTEFNTVSNRYICELKM